MFGKLSFVIRADWTRRVTSLVSDELELAEKYGLILNEAKFVELYAVISNEDEYRCCSDVYHLGGARYCRLPNPSFGVVQLQ